jgi:hypothetical protein
VLLRPRLSNSASIVTTVLQGKAMESVKVATKEFEKVWVSKDVQAQVEELRLHVHHRAAKATVTSRYMY